MLTMTSGDGTDVRATDEGRGACVLILHPGSDDGRSWTRVASRLTAQFRVVRLIRRQYRLDLTGASPCSLEQEVADVLALTEVIGQPLLLVGHSSGGVVASEAMVASPSAFAGAVVYEPPIELAPAEFRAALHRAQAAIANGRPGRALSIFLSDVVRIPHWLARLSAIVTLHPRWRLLVCRQINDLAAIDDLGVRLDSYAHLERPVVLLTGDRSPAHLGRRVDALAQVLPQANVVTLRGQGHDANLRAPAEVARVIADFANRVGVRSNTD